MTTRERVKQIVFDHTRVEGIHDDTTNNDLGIDSLDIVEVIMAMEKEFNIDITDAEIEKLRQFSDYVPLIE